MWNKIQQYIEQEDAQHTLNPHRLKPETYIMRSNLTDTENGTTNEAASNWCNVIQQIETERCQVNNDEHNPQQNQKEEWDMEEAMVAK